MADEFVCYHRPVPCETKSQHQWRELGHDTVPSFGALLDRYRIAVLQDYAATLAVANTGARPDRAKNHAVVAAYDALMLYDRERTPANG